MALPSEQQARVDQTTRERQSHCVQPGNFRGAKVGGVVLGRTWRRKCETHPGSVASYDCRQFRIRMSLRSDKSRIVSINCRCS
ncbi:hypothetical protein RRG08_025772 [Elysia crispata]|uniref:Uncharacterized protein n=1 Tax=Elysia crispata TaxID=231223 RepID=A0AAE1AI23_9GAST|nr:hypothetical protein RRG08_025772 [Elysia crispata]